MKNKSFAVRCYMVAALMVVVVGTANAQNEHSTLKKAEKLVAQLKPGGILVIPLNDGNAEHQKMLKIKKMDDGSLQQEDYGDFMFVPMLSGIANQ